MPEEKAIVSWDSAILPTIMKSWPSLIDENDYIILTKQKLKFLVILLNITKFWNSLIKMVDTETSFSFLKWFNTLKKIYKPNEHSFPEDDK